MSKKSFLKKVVDEMLNNDSMQNIKQSYNVLKKECDVFVDEIGIKNKKKKIEKNLKSSISKNINPNDIKKAKLKENLSLIFCFNIFICLMCLSFAMVNFLDDNIMLGNLFIILIPTITITIIMLCLRYANLTLKNHLKFLINKLNKKTNSIIKKIKKIFNNDIFIITIVAIIEIIFMISMIIVTVNNQ